MEQTETKLESIVDMKTEAPNQVTNNDANRNKQRNRPGGQQNNQSGGKQNRLGGGRNQQSGGNFIQRQQNNRGGSNMQRRDGMKNNMKNSDSQENIDNSSNFNENRGGNRKFMNGNSGGRDREMDRILEKLQLLNGSTVELPTIDTTEKKFSGRNRLFIGNLTNDVTEEEISELFKPYGESNELFLNKEKMFGFIRLDYHANAERAKRELDGYIRKGRPLKIRFAPNAATVRVKNLTQYVTNELLHAAFSVFGEIDRCVVIVDERGKSTCEGIVEFARKPAALCAIRRCNDLCFFLTSSLRPVIVEPYEQNDDIDGYTERGLPQKKSPDWFKERDVGPRFAQVGSFEHEYGTRWKQLSEIYKQKFEALKREQAMEEEKLEAQMEYARYEHETEMLREQLRAREQDRDRQKREWEMKERQVEEERVRYDEQLRQMQEEMMHKMSTQEEDLRRRQEANSLFLKAHQLNNMLDQQERYDTTVVGQGAGGGANIGSLMDSSQVEPKQLMNYERRPGGSGHRGNNYDDRSGWGNQGMGNQGNMGGGRRDDFQNKRRRY